jgi:peptide/nickel transport system substrate-binding protein
MTQDRHRRIRRAILAVVLVGLAVLPVAAATGQTTLRLATKPIVHIDPALIVNDAEVTLANAVYDYLVDLSPNGEILPRLAKAWEISEDGRVYRFQLEEGVRFHDGRPLTAEDVVYTFDRLRDPDSGYPTVDLYAGIVGIEAVGVHEVVFTLEQPNPFFLIDLADNHALVVPQGATAFGAFIGSGPFRVEWYEPEFGVHLTANPDYFIPGRPYLDRLEITFFADDAAAVNALLGDQVDIAWRLPPPLFLDLEGRSGIVLVDVPTGGFDLVRLRSDVPPGDDPLVVEAMKLATDREEIFQRVQQGLGAVNHDSPISPTYAAYYDETLVPPARDPQRARELLEQAGYPEGLQLELHVPESGGRPDFAVVLKDQWAEAGIDVEVVLEEESIYYGTSRWMDVTLGISGWLPGRSPQFYLDTMLVCGAKWNESRFCDPTFDALAETAGSTLDEAERIDAYHRIQEILLDRGPIVIPYFWATLAAIREGISGFELHPSPGRTDFREVSLN